MNLKKLTILHSNDLHGDFCAKEVDQTLLGGVSLLSGYVNAVRHEEENVIYAIAGDMFRGSLIDREYKGISTIELMNLLTPDVATLGNHEIDYGIAHLLFLEKCARFPIINANLYIKSNYVRLFRSHVILEVGGMKVLFIGILTEDILAQTKQEQHIGAMVDIHEAAEEIGKICDSYQTEDIDFTVLLTHIGFEADKKLAKLLEPEWGVDIIIGGHSHTLLEEPCVVAGIPIVQAASGTGQVGRFDIQVDTDLNKIHSYTWQLVPIDETHCDRDLDLEKLLQRYEAATDEKFNRYVTRFANQYTHPVRNRETELGKIFADILRDSLGLDLIILGSGSIRKEEFGPIIIYRDLVEIFPFDEKIVRVDMTGAQLKRALNYVFREGSLVEDAHTEFYQYSRGLKLVYSTAEKRLTEILFEGEPIDDERHFRVGMQKYHFINIEDFFSVSEAEVNENQPWKIVATSDLSVIDEWLSHQELVRVPTDERIVIE